MEIVRTEQVSPIDHVEIDSYGDVRVHRKDTYVGQAEVVLAYKGKNITYMTVNDIKVLLEAATEMIEKDTGKNVKG